MKDQTTTTTIFTGQCRKLSVHFWSKTVTHNLSEQAVQDHGTCLLGLIWVVLRMIIHFTSEEFILYSLILCTETFDCLTYSLQTDTQTCSETECTLFLSTCHILLQKAFLLFN